MQEKLIFYYSAMKGGKTLRLLQLAHDLEENGQNILLIKPKVDTKGADKVVSRINLEREVDLLLSKNEKLLSEKNLDKIWECNHILVDEAQFLTPKQVEELWKINKKMNLPITCLGLKSNFQSNLFPGAARLLALADEVIELDTNSTCKCGAPAKFNARKIGGKYTMEGDEVEIDGADEKVEYEPLCGSCYYQKVYSKCAVKKDKK